MRRLASMIAFLSTTSCSLLQGKDAVVVLNYSTCALQCAIEQARKEGHEQVVERLEAIARERTAKGVTCE